MLQSQITRSTWLVLSACNASGALLAVSASWPKRASAFVSTPRTDGSWSTMRTVAIVVGLTIELDRSYAVAGGEGELRAASYPETHRERFDVRFSCTPRTNRRRGFTHDDDCHHRRASIARSDARAREARHANRLTGHCRITQWSRRRA